MRPLTANPAPAHGTASRQLAQFTLGRWHFVLRQTVIEPGGASGWHYHDGTLLVFVARGTLSHPGTDCVPVVFRRGSLFREPSGAAHAHEARNDSDGPVTLFVLYRNPAGSPLSRSIAPPACA